MLKTEKINSSVTYIGALDPDLKVFDIVMNTKFGTTYNSYLIDCGEEFVLIDTAKENYFDEYIENLSKLCDTTKIKYLIVNHTEPDHSGEVRKLVLAFPQITVVGTPTALGFLKEISNTTFKSIEIKDETKLTIGNQVFSFVNAPNLHWPDSMFTYLESEKMLFTCDVFGAHYCTENIYNDLVQNKSDYDEAFKYYYDCIFSPFKPFVKSGLSKIVDFENIKMICPSHGPIIRDNLLDYKTKYLKWSDEIKIDDSKIAIVYASAYGFTSKLAEEIKLGVEKEGLNVVLVNLLETTKEEALFQIQSSAAFLLGSPTLNSEAVPPIWDIMLSLDQTYTNGRLAAGFGAFGWSGEAVRNIEGRLSQLKCEVYRPGLRIRFNPHYSEVKLKCAFNFGSNFAKKYLTLKSSSDNNEWIQIHTGKWKCLICGEIYEGEFPPKECPACSAPADQFIEVVEEKIVFSSSKEEKIFIIGSGISAISAINAIRKRNIKTYIEMISEDNELPYNRILLSKKLIPDVKIPYLKDKSWFDENNVKISLNKKVFSVIPNENKIFFCDGTYAIFDKLILANGARSKIDFVYGNDKTGVFYLRTKTDFEQIIEYAKNSYVNKVLIVGGGILGIEIASSIMASGKEVEIVEHSKKLIGKHLDDDASNLFKIHLEKNGIKSTVSEQVEEIYGTGESYKQVCAVKLKFSHEVVQCQMIIFATGILPNIEVAKSSGISFNRGLIVDNTMRTNFENIFACGDVSEFNNKIFGQWSIAEEQGKIAGANAIGDNLTFIEKSTSLSFNGFDYKIFSIGDLGFNTKENYQILELSDPQNEIYRKFYFTNNSFVGGILMGDTTKSVQLRKSISKSSSLQSFLDNHFLDE